MKPEVFEKEFKRMELTPIHLFLDNKGNVRWFVCISKLYEGVLPNAAIVYDRFGKAWVLHAYHEGVTSETKIDIQFWEFDGTVRFNSVPLERELNYDLEFPKYIDMV